MTRFGRGFNATAPLARHKLQRRRIMLPAMVGPAKFLVHPCARTEGCILPSSRKLRATRHPQSTTRCLIGAGIAAGRDAAAVICDLPRHRSALQVVSTQLHCLSTVSSGSAAVRIRPLAGKTTSTQQLDPKTARAAHREEPPQPTTTKEKPTANWTVLEGVGGAVAKKARAWFASIPSWHHTRRSNRFIPQGPAFLRYFSRQKAGVSSAVSLRSRCLN